ncbi:hypothetical protein [Pseudomonas viridiflava]|uniref:hypothetical protein n=1 Tax=Pseudomonas viridiflava TaxID=33069 RepID=UPI001786F472|nr:hypothetical protein [Pseudomonas syringae]MBD8799865.1 hypothetical protein [Pseudomonas syringae]MBD8811139.1 hypothetical protein [Pseudomonas syringae]MEE4181203.1 hypothetical protein [Pseudomonas viridiflava]
MKATSIPKEIQNTEIEKILQLEIIKHEKYRELYSLLKLEQSNRAKIRLLMAELALCAPSDYSYSPMSPSERFNTDVNKKTKNKKSDGSEGAALFQRERFGRSNYSK